MVIYSFSISVWPFW